jgi:FAD:protein FMN transferase
LKRFPVLLAGLILSPCAVVPPEAAAETAAEPIDEKIEEVYLTLDQALKVVLPRSEEILAQEISLTPEQQARIDAYSGRPIQTSNLTVYVGKSGAQIDGYALVTQEIGMYKPITSMVGIDAQGRVQEVAVMVYRESRGGEIQRKRFLNQYRGKRLGDPVRIQKDIIHVTGATLSVRSMNVQIRRALAVIHLLFLGKEL